MQHLIYSNNNFIKYENYSNLIAGNMFFKDTIDNKHNYNKILKNNAWGIDAPYINVFIIKGIGYQAELVENDMVLFNIDFKYERYLSLRVGHSYTIYLPIPEYLGIKVLHKDRKIIIFGFDKDKVYNFSNYIYKLRPPSVYTGRGIRIKKKNHRRKLGKKDIKKGKL